MRQNTQIDFISVSARAKKGERKFDCFGWAEIDPLPVKELERFFRPFCEAWAEYQARGLRRYRPRRSPDLFR